MRFVVTGAAGFIGSHLAETLQARRRRGGRDRLLHRLLRPGAEGGERPRHRRPAVDLAEDALDFTGFDGVFHLAGQPGVRSFGDVFPLYLRRNVLASQRVFEAAARDGVKVVFASSSSIYGAAERYPTPEDTPPRPLSPYGITKLACEQLAAAYRAPVRARLRRRSATSTPSGRGSGPTWRSPGSRTRSPTGGTFDLFGDGDQSRGWTYVSDVVDGTIAGDRWRSGTYNVGGALEASMNESIAMLERLAGATLDVRRHESAVPGDQRRTKADTTRIRTELGWEPQVSLDDGRGAAMGLGVG